MVRESLTSLSSASSPVVSADALRVDGDAIVYRLFDVGYEISLDRVLELLATQAPERVRPVRGEAQALQIPNPPITVILGTEDVVVAGDRMTLEVSARIFDFGVVSMRARVPAPPAITWAGFIGFGEVLDTAAVIPTLLEAHVRSLTERIRSCIDRPAIAVQTEDYIVYRVARLTDVQGVSALPSVLHDSLLSPLLAELQRTVADSTELVERVENALKVTDDVYLARIYAAALELFRGRTWRAGIDRKLAIIRETYSMLNDEQQSARSEALEVAIVLLIVMELLLAIFRY